MRCEGVSDRDSQRDRARIGTRPSRGAFYTTLDRLEAKQLVRWTAEGGDAGRDGLPQRKFIVTPEGVKALRASRKALLELWNGLDDVLANHDERSGIGDREPGSARPPRLADWILKRVLPLGKRGESILGDLHEEFFRFPVPGSRFPTILWYWQQTLRLALRYATSRSPQQSLTYPRSNPMWLDLTRRSAHGVSHAAAQSRAPRR